MPDVRAAHYPERGAIEAYGNGGFRFAGLSHRGSLLCLPSGMYGWDAIEAGSLAPDNFNVVFAERERIGFLLLGTGRTQIFPSPELRRAFKAVGLPLEVMDTGAACRTFNVLLAEQRNVAAALIAVE